MVCCSKLNHLVGSKCKTLVGLERRGFICMIASEQLTISRVMKNSITSFLRIKISHLLRNLEREVSGSKKRRSPQWY